MTNLLQYFIFTIILLHKSRFTGKLLIVLVKVVVQSEMYDFVETFRLNKFIFIMLCSRDKYERWGGGEVLLCN